MEGKKQIVTVLAAIFWAVGISLLVVATVIPNDMLIVAGWGLMSGLWACVWTGWALLLHERHRVETICQLAMQTEPGDGLRSL